MASDRDNLIARRSAITTELAALTSSRPGGKPTYQAGGESWQHQQYKQGLYDELKALNELIATADTGDGTGGGGLAYEIETIVVP